MLPFRRFPLRRALPSGWMAPWFLGLLWFCTKLFPEPAIPATGIQWALQNLGQCEGGNTLYVPPLRPDTALARQHPFTYNLPYLPVAALDTLRHWCTVAFHGQPLADFISLQATIDAARATAVDSTCVTGVRVRFYSPASFSSLTEVLGVMNIYGPRTYWLDVRHHPLTLYAVCQP